METKILFLCPNNNFMSGGVKQIFRQAETLAVHIWKVNSEGTTPDATAVSAGSAAVLLIFILIFNFGARRLGAYLHKKLTSA